MNDKELLCMEYDMFIGYPVEGGGKVDAKQTIIEMLRDGLPIRNDLVEKYNQEIILTTLIEDHRKKTELDPSFAKSQTCEQYKALRYGKTLQYYMLNKGNQNSCRDFLATIEDIVANYCGNPATSGSSITKKNK